MTSTLIREIEQSQLNPNLPEIAVGDTVDVHVRIIEGAKERIQVFTGVVIRLKGSGMTETMTVRRIVANEGVERTFPLHSPRIATVEVRRHGHVRRAKLYYLRDRVGKKRRLRDRRRGFGSVIQKEEPREETGAADMESQIEAEDTATVEGEEQGEEAKA